MNFLASNTPANIDNDNISISTSTCTSTSTSYNDTDMAAIHAIKAKLDRVRKERMTAHAKHCVQVEEHQRVYRNVHDRLLQTVNDRSGQLLQPYVETMKKTLTGPQDNTNGNDNDSDNGKDSTSTPVVTASTSNGYNMYNADVSGYAVKKQAAMCRTLHMIEIITKQLHLAKQRRDHLRKNYFRIVSNLAEERMQTEKFLMNRIADTSVYIESIQEKIERLRWDQHRHMAWYEPTDCCYSSYSRMGAGADDDSTVSVSTASTLPAVSVEEDTMSYKSSASSLSGSSFLSSTRSVFQLSTGMLRSVTPTKTGRTKRSNMAYNAGGGLARPDGNPQLTFI